MWPDGYDGAGFLTACASSRDPSGFLRDFTVTQAPNGYPGRYIVCGVNVANAAEQAYLDALCDDRLAREEYRRVLSNPFSSMEDLRQARRGFMRAKANAREASKSVRARARQRKWEEFSMRHPVIGKHLGRALVASRIAMHVGLRLAEMRKERKRAQRQRRLAELQRGRRRTRREVSGLLRSLFRFLDGSSRRGRR